MLTDHGAAADFLLDLHSDETSQFAGRAGVGELKFDDRAADHGHGLALQAVELSRHVGWLDQIGDGHQGRAAG